MFILSTSLTLISCRQTPNIRLVKTNNYFQPIRRQYSGGQPIRRQINGGYQAPSGYGAPASSAPSDYGQPVAAVVEAKGRNNFIVKNKIFWNKAAENIWLFEYRKIFVQTLYGIILY